jgi:hypothetical protein
MSIMLRNVLAIVAGIIIGSVTNMGFIILGSQLIPPPAGVDVNNLESIKASIHLYGAKHFIFPFLAHAGGALVGALAASLIAGSLRMILAFAVGGFFLLGGIAASVMIPAPLWFIAADLIIAYLPMAWLGWKLSGKG